MALEAASALALPALRDDVTLVAGAPTADGGPGWLLYDPVRHRYFTLDPLGFEMVARWGLAEGGALLRAVREQTPFRPGPDHLRALVAFLQANFLTRTAERTDSQRLAAVAAKARTGWVAFLVHRYLFFRVPLLRPQRLLDTLAPLVSPLFGRAWGWILQVLAVIGLYLAGRQWETFLSTFTAFGTWEGQATLVGAIVLSKVVHEFGHALTLHRFGGRVPTMGLAFLLMVPMLYTDTTDSWRLASRRQRLAVGAAGVKAELALAAVALFLWGLTPDGAVRAALFILATTVWIATVAVNISPFMRFDGYYLLSDALGVPNLQERAFALGRWWLREALFGLDVPPPEPMARRRRRILVVYAYLTWAYRLSLFLGIAAVVYHLFFKALGIVLFLIEISFFIARPVARELKAWWDLRGRLRPNAALLRTIAAAAGLVALVAVPWRTTVVAPAVVEAAQRAELYPVGPSRLETVEAAPGASVAAGAVLYRLSAPQLAFERDRAARQLAIARMQLERLSTDRTRIAEAAVLTREAARLAAEREGLERRLAQTVITAPIAGRLVDVPNFLRPGVWVNETVHLGTVVDEAGAHLIGYVREQDLAGVAAGARFTFVPDDPVAPRREGRIERLSTVGGGRLGEAGLASVYGGPIAAVALADGSLRSEGALYRVEASLPDVTVRRRMRGAARIEGKPASLIGRFVRQAGMVLIRESGF